MQNNDNRRPEGEHPVKRAAMATIGTVADAVEKAADMLSGVINKENIDRMAKKGEETIGRVADFGESVFEKVKHALDSREAEEMRESLSDAADGLRRALEKAGDALQRAVDRGDEGGESGKLMEELNRHKEQLGEFIRKMRAAAREEGDMVAEEWAKLKKELEEEQAALRADDSDEQTEEAPAGSESDALDPEDSGTQVEQAENAPEL